MLKKILLVLLVSQSVGIFCMQKFGLRAPVLRHIKKRIVEQSFKRSFHRGFLYYSGKKINGNKSLSRFSPELSLWRNRVKVFDYTLKYSQLLSSDLKDRRYTILGYFFAISLYSLIFSSKGCTLEPVLYVGIYSFLKAIGQCSYELCKMEKNSSKVVDWSSQVNKAIQRAHYFLENPTSAKKKKALEIFGSLHTALQLNNRIDDMVYYDENFSNLLSKKEEKIKKLITQIEDQFDFQKEEPVKV